MTAVKSFTHIQQLAQQRLPVPSAEVERLCERVKELEDERGDAASYLIRNVLRPNNARPLDDLMGICTQVDHIAATARNRALEEAAEYCHWHVMCQPTRGSKATHSLFIPAEWLPENEETSGRHHGHGYAAAIRSLMDKGE